MRRKGLGVGLLGTSALVLAVVIGLAINPIASASTIGAKPVGKVAVEYKEVDQDAQNCAPTATYCKACPYYLTYTSNGSSTHNDQSVCVDYVEATGASVAWKATFSQGTSDFLGEKTSGTVNPGQKVEILFQAPDYCLKGNPCNAVKISGPDNVVWISFAWD